MIQNCHLSVNDVMKLFCKQCYDIYQLVIKMGVPQNHQIHHH